MISGYSGLRLCRQKHRLKNTQKWKEIRTNNTTLKTHVFGWGSTNLTSVFQKTGCVPGDPNTDITSRWHCWKTLKRICGSTMCTKVNVRISSRQILCVHRFHSLAQLESVRIAWMIRKILGFPAVHWALATACRQAYDMRASKMGCHVSTYWKYTRSLVTSPVVKSICTVKTANTRYIHFWERPSPLQQEKWEGGEWWCWENVEFRFFPHVHMISVLEWDEKFASKTTLPQTATCQIPRLRRTKNKSCRNFGWLKSKAVQLGRRKVRATWYWAILQLAAPIFKTSTTR